MSLAENLPCIQTTIPVLTNGFFKPVSSSVIEQLLWQYKAELNKTNKLHQFINSDNMQSAINYRLRAGEDPKRHLASVFGSVEDAIKVIDSDYWQSALNATDVFEYMPQKRRSEWNESIRSRNVPSFEEETVINTLRELLLARDKFLSERVDGLFKALSGEHVTNAPEGFSKRMIMYITNSYSNHMYIQVDSTRTGYLHDLRLIIAKFMDREPPRFDTTYDLIKSLYDNKRTGEWLEIDGGALRLKVFLKGTAHLEVHPDLAWRLNEILAILHPRAIPPKYRKRPEKALKEFSLTKKLIPFDVLDLLRHTKNEYIYEGEGRFRRTVGKLENVFFIEGLYAVDKNIIAQAFDILQACGGKRLEYNKFEFDYDFKQILFDIISSGYIPDHVAHQYYPTPTPLAERLVNWCEIHESDHCLEPSAGQGAIAKFMPKFTTCVEVSTMFCEILKKKGHNVVNGDFLEWSKGAELFSRICLNPPYDQGRAQAHLTAAANLLKKEGILTALVPSSIKNKSPLKGFVYEWKEVDQNEFPGVSIDISMVKMIRKEYPH